MTAERKIRVSLTNKLKLGAEGWNLTKWHIHAQSVTPLQGQCNRGEHFFRSNAVKVHLSRITCPYLPCSLSEKPAVIHLSFWSFRQRVSRQRKCYKELSRGIFSESLVLRECQIRQLRCLPGARHDLDASVGAASELLSGIPGEKVVLSFFHNFCLKASFYGRFR